MSNVERLGARYRALIRRYGSAAAAARAVGMHRGTILQIAAEAEAREASQRLAEERIDALEQQKEAV